MLKRLSFFLSIFLIIGLVIAIGWFIRYRNASPSPDATTTQPDDILPPTGQNIRPATSSQNRSSSSPSIIAPGEKPFGMVADQEVAAYYPYADGSVAFIQPSGQVIKISGTEGVVLSSLNISDLSYAAFSYDGKRIVAAFGNPLNRQLSVFDLEKKSWNPIFARPLSAPLWAPRDYRITFLTANTNNDQIITVVDTQPNTPKTQEILSLSGQDLVLSWKNDNEIFVSEKTSVFSLGSLFSLDIRKNTLSSLIKDWPGLDFLWDTTSQAGVAFQANKNSVGGTMSLLGETGIVARKFSFTTLPKEKCFFGPEPTPLTTTSTSSSRTPQKNPSPRTSLLFCAVPKNADSFLSSYLPDAYFQKEIMTDDNLVGINLETGAVTDLSKPINEVVDATDLKASRTYIYFINRYNNKLYRLIRA